MTQEEKIQRTVKFISTLSPWNLERGEEALRELIAEERLEERKNLALDNYHGHTFSDATDYKMKFEKFIRNNERRIKQLQALASKDTSL